MFEVDNVVQHTEGGYYIVEHLPIGSRLLGHWGSTFYEYRCVKTGIMWMRNTAEFEDGRFKLVAKDVW